MKRKIFYLSDRTGITAETLGHSLLTQFEGIEFERESLRFIDTEAKAHHAVELICQVREGGKPLVFSTLIDAACRDIVARAPCVFFDLFDAFIGPLERELRMPSSHTAGRSHGMYNSEGYASRINAINFTLTHDDGVTTRDYEHAELILVGVSRSGKTPTCLYLALQYGIFAANYPLTEEDFGELILPARIRSFRAKILGLTIRPERLQRIRTERRPGSRYASLHQCRFEVSQVEALYRKEGVYMLDSTTMSVEELAVNVLDRLKLRGDRRPLASPLR